MTWPSVTVNVLTYNGEQYLDQLLTAVETQEYPGDVEILVIDSGSTDGTLEIIRRHEGVRLHEIPNAEFGHGRTRQLAAELATGEVVAYLTHDAVPANDRWLREMMRPFADDPRIAAVVGRQVARRNAPPTLKYDIRRTFDSLGPRHGLTVVWDTGAPDVDRDAVTFYSDANSAARRRVLLEQVPYRDVAYAEDQVFGRDLWDAGLRRAYAPAGVVEHSNDSTLRTFGSRVAADVAGLRAIGTAIPRLSLPRAVANWGWGVLRDSASIIVDPDYDLSSKLRWLLVNPWYQLAKWSAYRREVNRRPSG